MESKYSHLLSPLQIGKLQLKNRMIVAPMGAFHNMQRGPHFEYSDSMIEYITERAVGGFGAFICSTLKPDYLVDPCDVDNHFMKHKSDFRSMALRLNERAGYHGMKVIQQLTFGQGRNYSGLYSCSENPVFWSPSEKTRVLSKEQIKQKIDCMVEAAELMKESGFAGIEVHALHWGYLLDNFAMAITNKRTDEYGGCLENRLRVCKEIVEAIKQVCGSDYPVGMRLGLKSYIQDFNKPDLTGEHETGRTLEEGVRIAKLLEEYGYDVLNVDVGMYDSFYYAAAPQYMPDGYVIPLAAEAKKAVNIPVLCGSRMADPDMSDKAIADGLIDAAVIGRASLADPYFAKKIEMGRPERIRPCINCLVGCLGNSYKGKVVGCAVNAAVRHEITEAIGKAPEAKRIAVIGGGVAGLEVARVSKLRGHDVIVYEKTARLGGLQIPAGAHSFKKHNHMLVKWYCNETERLHIPVEYNCEMTTEKLIELSPDIAVFAVGSVPIMPGSISGINHPKCVSAVDMLNGKVHPGKKVVVVGGGLVGCETAIDLAMGGHEVTLVEAADAVLSASAMIAVMVEQMIPDLLEYYNVNVMTSHKIEAINDIGALVSSTTDGEITQLEADNVIMSIGMRPVPSHAEELYGSGIEVHVVGDCVAPGMVYTAVNGAYDLARRL